MELGLSQGRLRPMLVKIGEMFLVECLMALFTVLEQVWYHH